MLRNAPFVLIIFALVAISSGCASTPTRVEPGTRLDVPEEIPELGPLEEQLKSFVEQITEILSAPTDDPNSTVTAIGRYLDENKDAITVTTQEVANRIAAMTPDQRAYYDEHFSEFFTPTTRAWYAALDAFRQEHPAEATRIDGLMIFFD